MNPDFLKRYKIGEESDEENLNNERPLEFNNEGILNKRSQGQNVSEGLSSQQVKVKVSGNEAKAKRAELDTKNKLVNPNPVVHTKGHGKQTINKNTEEFINSYTHQSKKAKDIVNNDQYNQDHREDLASDYNYNFPEEKIGKAYPETNDPSINMDLVNKVNIMNQFNPNFEPIQNIEENIDSKFPSAINTNSNDRAEVESNKNKFHHLQIIDEDVENFKRRLDIMVKNFRTDTLNDFMSIKRNLLTEQRNSIEAEKQKCEGLISAKTNQIENLKEALAKTKQLLLNETEIKDRLALKIFRMKDSKKIINKKEEAFRIIKENYLFEKRSLLIINRIQNYIVNYNLKKRLFRMVQDNYYKCKQERIIEEKEKVMDTKISEVSVKYNKDINDMRIKLNEAHILINKYKEQRNAIQENLKKTLMRGVVAMNFEAMNILDTDGDPLMNNTGVQGLNQSSVNNQVVGNPFNQSMDVNLQGYNNKVSMPNNNASVALNSSQIQIQNNNEVGAKTTNNVTNTLTTGISSDIKGGINSSLKQQQSNTGRFSPISNSNQLNNLDISSNTNMSFDKSQIPMTVTNTNQYNRNVPTNLPNNNMYESFNTSGLNINNKETSNQMNMNNMTNITNNSYLVEQLENKAVGKDSNWINACSVPIQMKNSLIQREEDKAINVESGKRHDLEEEDKPYTHNKNYNMYNTAKINQMLNINQGENKYTNTGMGGSNQIPIQKQTETYQTQNNNMNQLIKENNEEEGYSYEDLTSST
mmetsp:Transcript_35036/g.36439  ORF Transcript_35036/g.36439 Transcript_35036/m.36439 type:complete len:756 (-) Transcript_35036:410-2677(-)